MGSIDWRHMRKYCRRAGAAEARTYAIASSRAPAQDRCAHSTGCTNASINPRQRPTRGAEPATASYPPAQPLEASHVVASIPAQTTARQRHPTKTATDDHLKTLTPYKMLKAVKMS